MGINSITHPLYDAMITLWYKYRLTYDGGRDFIDYYLKRYSTREDETEFQARKEISYCPAHAKAAVNEIKNSIFQRTTDITRVGGPLSFLNACTGTDTAGVDSLGNTMNSFIGRIILPELLTMSKVGVYIDKPEYQPETRADQLEIRPYLYYYIAEDIRSWAYDHDELVTVLLRDHTFKYDEFGLPSAEVERFRLVSKTANGVQVQFFDQSGTPIDKDGNSDTIIYNLKIPRIPFVIFEITSSLLTDAADYQIALLNLASSDLHYALKANFPFYTEQYNPNFELDHLLRAGQTLATSDATDPTTIAGTASEAAIAKGKEIRVGATRGRRYPTGTERPAFIHPSAEPLNASMMKQDKLQEEIRRLVNLNVTNIEPRRQSAESREYDERGLESGLSYIGLELEFGERCIAEAWANYEYSDPTVIKYPDKYSLKSDSQRYNEAKELENSADRSPSMSYRKIVAKEAATLRIGHRISADKLATIHKEIDQATVIMFGDIQMDIEAGLISPETASELIRLYPKGEVDKASKAHAERLARIAISQSEGAAAGARGIADASPTPKTEAAEEKKESRDKTKDDVVTRKTRGGSK